MPEEIAQFIIHQSGIRFLLVEVVSSRLKAFRQKASRVKARENGVAAPAPQTCRLEDETARLR
ncbi:hypothetical protein [Microvirga subterranea]|uniref:hypothetical protein n=1 Tax=Microvirga subterranea TaxID=186651 RepID=UPI0011C02783|nr:hypothetical protein [Microvirga subterranea]